MATPLVGADEATNYRTTDFDIRTARCDASRANLVVTGRLDASSAPVVEQVVDGHLRAGRRFLRIHLGDVSHLDDAAAAMLGTCHDALLARRGTFILTGVHDELRAAFALAGLDHHLFLVEPSAADALA